MARKKLGEMLVEAGVLSDQALRMALAEQRRWGGSLGRTLVEMKAISEAELVSVLSHQLGMQTVDLDHIEIEASVLELVPGELAEQHSVIPFAQPMKFLDVAMAEPMNLGVIDELRIRTQLNIRPYLAGPKMIERALGKFYRRGFARTRGGRYTQDVSIAMDQGDVLSPTASGNNLKRPNEDEIDAARRREGLPARPRRTPPLGVSAAPAPAPAGPVGPPSVSMRDRDAEIDALQDRLSRLEALIERDEEVLRKLLALLVEKDIATRDEILERLR
jgi:hypothetical protein